MQRGFRLNGVISMVVVALVVAFMAMTSHVVRSGSGEDEHVVREVFTERSAYAKGSTELIAETWTLVAHDGSARAFIGRYYSTNGSLVQAQVRTPDRELVLWTNYQDSGSTCLEQAPPAPKGLDGLVPKPVVDADLRAMGYERGGQRGPGPAASPSLKHPPEDARESRQVDLDASSLWNMALQGAEGGARRERVVAVDSDGFVVGFWSVTRDASGTLVGSNSRVLHEFQLYDGSVFDRVLQEVTFGNVTLCG